MFSIWDEETRVTMDPKVIIRLGSHAEKEYLLKTVKFFDGLLIAANLVEATPAATASLIVKAGGHKLATPYFLNPMTYAYGTYVDRLTGQERADLDWIMSDQKDRKSGQTKRDFKRSYRQLSEALGGPFSAAIARKRAITPVDFSSKQNTTRACESVIEYQLTRISEEFLKDEEFQHYASNLPPPAAVFAPYFYAEPTQFDAWMDVNLELARVSAALEPPVPVHAILCVDQEKLTNDHFNSTIVKELPKTGVSAVWFWFSRFQEDIASTERLLAFRSLVETLSTQMEVYNLHGGFFSLALSHLGLSGISHGIGYGEQKDVIPVIGQSIPTVRYYLPDLYKRIGVPRIQRCFHSLGINVPADFHSRICRCVVCKGVVSQSLSDFTAFGDMHYSRPQSKRLAQTPAAAKRCRFHFLLNRIRERDQQKLLSLQQTRLQLSNAIATWETQAVIEDEVRHLRRWIAALS